MPLLVFFIFWMPLLIPCSMEALAILDFNQLKEWGEINGAIEDHPDSAFGNHSVKLKKDDIIKKWHNQHVQIRGFLYHAPDGRWILASEPNLKTCCIGSSAKSLQQITVLGAFDEIPLSQAVALQGTFQIEGPLWNKQSGPIIRYYLINAKIFPQQNHFPWKAFLLAGISLVLVYLAVTKIKKKPKIR
jgi:hypothetical protein